MTGFVIATGRSGTTWMADALRRCTDRDARHESMRYTVGPSFARNGVEVNGNLWQQASIIRDTFPGVSIVHLVRDGRLVVRSALSNARRHDPHRTLEQTCRTWVARNERMISEVHWSMRFRLEGLTTDFATFQQAAGLLGAGRVDPVVWDRIRNVPRNVTAVKSVPPFAAWSNADRDRFWAICGPVMETLRYGL